MNNTTVACKAIDSILLTNQGFAWSEDRTQVTYLTDSGCGGYVGGISTHPENGEEYVGRVISRAFADNYPVFGYDSAIITLDLFPSLWECVGCGNLEAQHVIPKECNSCGGCIEDAGGYSVAGFVRNKMALRSWQDSASGSPNKGDVVKLGKEHVVVLDGHGVDDYAGQDQAVYEGIAFACERDAEAWSYLTAKPETIRFEGKWKDFEATVQTSIGREKPKAPWFASLARIDGGWGHRWEAYGKTGRLALEAAFKVLEEDVDPIKVMVERVKHLRTSIKATRAQEADLTHYYGEVLKGLEDSKAYALKNNDPEAFAHAVKMYDEEWKALVEMEEESRKSLAAAHLELSKLLDQLPSSMRPCACGSGEPNPGVEGGCARGDQFCG